jgi:flagellar motility protein MotE (MotC chaperone)
MKFIRDVRLIRLALMAFACFGVIKIASLVLQGGYIFREEQPGKQAARPSWAKEMLNFPDGRPPSRFDKAAAEITGSVNAPKNEEAPPAAPAAVPPDSSANQPATSPAERAVLERLQSRRQELEARARELDIRENLLKAQEGRLQAKLDEVKATEERITSATRQKDEAESARFKNIVTMYENMKPKDAARIFDRLDMATLFDVASNMKPQKMADVLAQMQPEAAERLTVEMARRNGAERAMADLPKIEGRPANAAAMQNR